MNDRVVAQKGASAEKEQVDKLTLDEDRPEGARRIHYMIFRMKLKLRQVIRLTVLVQLYGHSGSSRAWI